MPCLRLASLLACAGAALLIRKEVAVDQIGDQAGLIASGAVVAALVVGAGSALRSLLHRRAVGRAGFAALAVGYLTLLAAFIDTSLVDASVEMESLVEAQNPATPPATVVLGPTGVDVRLTGELQDGVARRLDAILSSHPAVTRIHLTSEGGLADEGQALGDVINAHHLSTFVPDYCVSACTLAFVRGHERVMLDDTRIGFHAPYQQGLFGAMYQGDPSDQRAGYRAAGVSPAFVDAALKVDPASIWYPSAAELKAAHVITGVVDRYSLPDSELDGAADLPGARELILRNFPIMAAIEKTAPHALDKVAAWYLDRYRLGRTEGANADALKTVVKAAVAFGLARADDITLAETARVLAEALDETQTPRLCTALADKADLALAARLLDDSAEKDQAETLFAAALSKRSSALRLAPTPAIAPPTGPLASSRATASCEDGRERMKALLDHDDVAIAAAMRPLVEASAQQARGAILVLLHPDR